MEDFLSLGYEPPLGSHIGQIWRHMFAALCIHAAFLADIRSHNLFYSAIFDLSLLKLFLAARKITASIYIEMRNVEHFTITLPKSRKAKKELVCKQATESFVKWATKTKHGKALIKKKATKSRIITDFMDDMAEDNEFKPVGRMSKKTIGRYLDESADYFKENGIVLPW